jgi:HlyD family secretion protein
MADNNPIFRKVSLERLSSPEQLDMLMQVTSPKGWVALLALCGLGLVAIGWGIFGSIPTKVNGSCILIRPGGVSEIVAPGAGRMADISVEVGDSVREGQTIARIERSDTLDQIRTTEAKLHELKAQEKQLKAIDAQSEQQQTAYLRESDKNLNSRIRNGEENLRTLEAKIQNQAKLLEQGLITKQTLLATKLDYANAKQDIDDNRNKLLQNESSRIDTHKQIQNELTAIAIQINEASRNLASQIRGANESSLVASPYNGRIVEIRLAENAQVSAGTPILTIEQTGKSVNDLEANIYVAPLDGKKITTNMDVQISPSTVKAEEFGVMLGKVRTVSEFPSTTQGMMRLLNNDQLVQQLAAGAAPIALQADLTPSASTVSGYQWSSPKGPGTKIQSGTLCTATITVKQQRPISLVIPMLGDLLGG